MNDYRRILLYVMWSLTNSYESRSLGFWNDRVTLFRMADTGVSGSASTGQMAGSSSSAPPTSSSGSAGSGLVINRRRQEGNPLLKYVRNVRYEWGDIGPDFECGSNCGVLYLALKVSSFFYPLFKFRAFSLCFVRRGPLKKQLKNRLFLKLQWMYA